MQLQRLITALHTLSDGALRIISLVALQLSLYSAASTIRHSHLQARKLCGFKPASDTGAREHLAATLAFPRSQRSDALRMRPLNRIDRRKETREHQRGGHVFSWSRAAESCNTNRASELGDSYGGPWMLHNRIAVRLSYHSKQGESSVEQGMQRRYQSLQLHDAISRRNDYVEACKELQGILKAVYVGAPKPFQALLYEDVVHAFRTLPGLENSQQLGAARLLLHTVEDIFPKQRRAAAAHEYKIARIAWHRQYRNPEALPEHLQLSGDTLRHVFEYLDARSLAIASAVCRAWNVAATDDTLWRTQFLSLFGTSNRCLSLMNVTGIRDGVRKPDQDKNSGQSLQKSSENAGGAWRKAFNLAQKGRSSQLFMSNRAYCPVCKDVIWLVDPPWKPVKGKCVARKQILESHSPRPMSVKQVVRYVVSKDTASASESSSSDSDDYDAGKILMKLWNVSKFREY